MTARRSHVETEIPLFLIPHAIARQINERGDDVFRISVKRMHWHHYNVTVRTKKVARELRVRTDVCPAGDEAGNRNDTSGGERCGGAA